MFFNTNCVYEIVLALKYWSPQLKNMSVYLMKSLILEFLMILVIRLFFSILVISRSKMIFKTKIIIIKIVT